MKKWRYAYTLAMEMDSAVFAKACRTIESIPGIQKSRPLYEDFLDGSQYQEYALGDQKIYVSSDWDIGAVLVEADFSLDSLFPDALLKRECSAEQNCGFL